MAKKKSAKVAPNSKVKRIDVALREAINRSGLTTYAVAKSAGTAVDSLYRFMSGERDLRLKNAANIAQLLGLELRPTSKGDGE